MFLSAVWTLILTAPIYCIHYLFWWRNKIIYILDGLRVIQFWTIPLNSKRDRLFTPLSKQNFKNLLQTCLEQILRLFVSEINGTFHKPSLFIFKAIEISFLFVHCSSKCHWSINCHFPNTSKFILTRLTKTLYAGKKSFFKKNKTLEMRRANHGSKMKCIIFIFFLYPRIAVIQYDIAEIILADICLLSRYPCS